MSWYSLLGIAVGAWVAASLAAGLLLGRVVSALKANRPALLTPAVVAFEPRRLRGPRSRAVG